ncbi:talin_middle and talin-RS domain-containing protein rhea isoform X2 [Oratosquilla oratoria]|uniref:talin_middle and talin-RS domain-containing protein rhea isoform X2 n=1 Tax=Oratosquilla oratoria TaxID=337810 RepID=UPI003F769E03
MALSLKVHIVEQNVTKTMQFDGNLMVFDACRIIREKITEANLGQAKDYGLFLAGEEGKGVWLEMGRNLNYYLLRNGDIIEYRRKMRTLKVRMLDGTVKTLLVDDSQPVANLMVIICTKIGIMNHDEYSLVREIEQEEVENKPNFGTLTIRRKKEGDKEKDAKMEQLKKKIRTDDEMNWVDHSKTLREQGIDENEVLLLRRKYFFSDQNIDSRDPVQLNLLYVQCRDAILDGTHPVTQERACEFAGIQCHIQFGDHLDSKHKQGFLDLKEFIPQGYLKVKGIEKKIFAEHKKHVGLNELEAKVVYVRVARSLKTYGVTFYLVKEKMKGKNKLVPRLLGVTKDSVLRLDEKTKEILKTWPLTTVRRWAASPNTFTLDFGDYSDQYYSVQTTEGEPISQLIAGYIDIILKKQKAKDHIGIEGDDGSAMLEDTVSPIKANIIQHKDSGVKHFDTDSIAKPAVMRPGANGAQTFGTGAMPSVQSVAVVGQINLAHQAPSAQQPKVTSVLTKPQKALVSTIETGKEVITTCIDELETKAELPELGTDAASVKWKQVTLDSNKQTVTSQIAAMNAATAEVVTLTSSVHEEVDHTAVGAAIHTITSNLPEMTKGVKMIAALLEGEKESTNILDATKLLCSAFSDLLTAAEPEKKESRQNLLGAASRVGEASNAVLTNIDDNVDHETQDILLGLAKAVANTTAALILKAKAVASKCEDQELQNVVINSATSCALATSQLVACAKVVAPTIDNPGCQRQIIEASKEVGNAVESMVQVCQLGTQDEGLLRELSHAAAEVTKALNDLLNHIKNAGAQKGRLSVHDEAVETILISSDKLFASQGDASEMVRQAKILAQATSHLIQNIKFEAESQTDSEMQKRLLAAAKQLADATAKMVEAAKLCASHPNDEDKQEALKVAAEGVRIATNAAAANALKKKIIKRLENAAKHAAATGTQCMAAAQGAGPHNSNPSTQDGLISDCKSVADVIPRLVEGVKGTINEPESPRAQLGLINACNQFLQPGTKMVGSVKAALPTVSDQASALQLNNSSKQFGQALVDLRTAMGKAQEACGSLEIDSALDAIQALNEDLNDLKTAADTDTLRPLPGETPESAAQQLSNSSKTVGSTMAQLLTSASQANQHFTGIASRDTALALKEFSSAVRMVVATSVDHSVRHRLIDAAREVMVRSSELIEEARVVVQGPQSTASQQKLAQVAKGVSQALNKTVSSLPGQKDVDDAIKNITDCTNDLESGNFPISTRPYGELQVELTNAAAELNEASTEVVTSARQSTQHLATSSKKFSTAFGSLMGVGMEMAGQTHDQEVRGNMVISLKSVSMSSSKLLVSAKAVSADPGAPNAKNQLAAAARAVTDSINNLIDVCTSAAPGQKECDNAVRAIQSMKPMLENPSEPVNDSSYFECLDNVMDRSKNLGDGMTGIANFAKRLEHDKFGVAVKDVSDAICGLVESAAQAAYLVGISDPTSVAGRPGLVDQSQFARAYEAIISACQTLNDKNSNQQQVLSAATIIAKHTSALCNSCRVASAKTNNPVAKRHFVQSAKDVANATANLVKEIKALDQDYSDENRSKCAQATKPLLEAVDNLCTFANSPDFASVPAKISTKARQSQEPITSSGKSIINGSCSMIESAKSLAVNPKDPPTWQSLASHSKSVSDSIKKLVSSIRDKAPGQKECDEAIQKLNINIRDLDQASLCVLDQNLAPQTDNNLQGYNEQVQNAGQELLQNIDKVRGSAKSEAEKLGHSITQMCSYFDPLVNSAIGSASNMRNSKQQMCLLDQTKTVAECALQLIYAAKEVGGNPKATHAHPDVDDAADTMKETLMELLSTVETIATEAGVVSGLLDSITSAMNRIDDPTLIGSDENWSFVDYQTRMVTSAKEIAKLAQDMVAKSSADPSHLGNLAASVSHQYNSLSADSTGAIRQSSNSEVAGRLKSSVHELGQSCMDLVKTGGHCQAAPKDTFVQRDLAEAARLVGEKVSHVLAALQAGSRGTQACINAASTVSGIIGDLDTTIMFATAGTLNAENEEENFSDHRENILKTAKALVEDTKTLVAGAASSQEQLAVAAQNAVTTIVQLSEVVKSGATSLGSNNPEAQVMLINAVKDVSMALGDLIHATKAASGKSIHDPAMTTLKESAKVMVTNVTSLLKTVKAVEDEHTRGSRALEATIEAIAQEIRAFDSDEAPKTKATPEDLVRVTKPITLATAKAVGAGNSCKQDDIIVAANMGRKAISDMLTTCKAAAWCAETYEVRSKVMTAGHDSAVQYRELLQMVMHLTHKPSPEARQMLTTVSRKIAQYVTDVVASAELLKGEDWEDPDDPTVIAESELIGAANSIDAAARKLMALRPRRTETKEVDESLNFDEIILEACKSIAAATGALVKAASSAQRELVDLGKVKWRPTYSSDDGQWSEGLISAARLVAAATHSLCEAANSMVRGHATEEKLISAAKQVAGSTAQLLVACKVKADPDSQATKRLQAAGNAVKRATDNLVRAAQQAIENDEERTLILNRRFVGGMAQEIKIKEEVLKIERDLAEARSKLVAFRKAKYKDGNESGMSDTDGYLSGYESSTRYDSSHEASGLTPGRKVKISYSVSPNQTLQSNGEHRGSNNSLNQTPLNQSGSTQNQSVNKSRSVITSHILPSSMPSGGNTYSQTVTISNHSLNNSLNQSGASESGAEFDDGPTFREALRAFQNQSGSSSLNTSTKSSSQKTKSYSSAEQILTSSTQHIEKTMHVTSSTKSFGLDQS